MTIKEYYDRFSKLELENPEEAYGLLDAANYVEAVQTRQGLYVSCLEEIAYRKGYISKAQLLELAQPLLKTEYGQYLVKIANEVI